MKPRPETDWAPSSELLAAYADGEFEGRDDLAQLRQRLEDWLTAHPAEQARLAEYRRLRQFWLDTTPPEPSPASWDRVFAGIRAGESLLPPARAAFGWRPLLAAAAACILVLAAVWLPIWRMPTPVAGVARHEEEVFPVAAASEVTILRVEGADTSSVVVGELPLQGALELVGPGEVTLTSVQPDARDNMVPHFVSGPGRPMFWARLDSD